MLNARRNRVVRGLGRLQRSQRGHRLLAVRSDGPTPRTRRMADVRPRFGAVRRFLAVDPFRACTGARRIRRLRADASLSEAERRERAHTLLERAASAEQLNSGWLSHVAGIGYAMGSTAFIYFRNSDAPADQLWLAAALQFATTVLVVECSIWSTPRRARRDLEALNTAPCAGHRRGPPCAFVWLLAQLPCASASDQRRASCCFGYCSRKAIAILPSPTTAATRLMGLRRTSPQAKTPGTLVSSR